MFFFFKTRYSYSNGLDQGVNELGSFFVHDTGSYENKICTFGKIMAITAILLWVVRIMLISNPDFKGILLKATIVFDAICVFLAGVMNLNAFIYIVPLMFFEMFFVKRLL
jgi:hypothetical protein